MKILVTGGAGFIGSALVRRLLETSEDEVVVVDNFTYAANPASILPLEADARFRIARMDIADRDRIFGLFEVEQPDAVMHLAAESHVDRSIMDTTPFIETNVIGTHVLLEAARAHWNKLKGAAREQFRFLHVSTDEVYGSLGETGAFSETTPYDPSSPYSASKAASDHLVRAWGRTFGLPIVMTNCSNNFGPRQHPEKLIPLMILNALEGLRLPVYGDGLNVRDWIHVEDHAAALDLVLRKGVVGQSYNVGARSEEKNIDVVQTICARLDEVAPKGFPHAELIEYVTDRPGHDRRYAIDSSKIESELGWKPEREFHAGLRETVDWYLANPEWWAPVRTALRLPRTT